MRTPIADRLRHVGAAILIGLGLLALATFNWGFVQSEALAARPDNPRRMIFDQRIRRGDILDRNGTVLAHTEFDGEDAPERRYPVPEAAPVTGFQTWRYGAGSGDASYGAGGAEAAYDPALRGDLRLGPGALLATKLLHRPQVGQTVTLTLDADLQIFAARELGSREGAVVVLDVETGAVRALVSSPTFDATSLDNAETPPDDPEARMLNRATQGTYPPGSIWKTVTLAAGLNEGVIDVFTEVDDGDQVEYFEGFPVRCDNNPTGVTRFDIEHAYAYSCNVTFARVGAALGPELYAAYAQGFGVGREIPFPLPVAESQLSNDSDIPLPELASAAFGQGELLVTPLHMAVITAGFARESAMPKPYLLESVEDGDAADLEDRGAWLEPVSTGVSRAVMRAMVTSVRDGWARAATTGLDLTAGGKTGTAEVGDPGLAPHAWFIGFAPAEEPRLAVAVLVVNGGEGSRVAAPIGGRVLAEGLRLEQRADEAGVARSDAHRSHHAGDTG